MSHPCCIKPLGRTTTSLPSFTIAEQKAKRRQVLEAVQQRRKLMYQRCVEKLRKSATVK